MTLVLTTLYWIYTIQLIKLVNLLKQELSRRQREEIQKAEAKRRYEKLHAQGKTDEARADLARLALIRKEREAAAARKKVEKEEAEKRARERKEASLNATRSGPGARRARNKKKK